MTGVQTCALPISAIEGRDLDSDISQLQIREQSLEREDQKILVQEPSLVEDISLQSYKDTASSIHVNHFIDVRLVGFKRNGNGNVLLNEQRLFEYLDLLGQ